MPPAITPSAVGAARHRRTGTLRGADGLRRGGTAGASRSPRASFGGMVGHRHHRVTYRRDTSRPTTRTSEASTGTARVCEMQPAPLAPPPARRDHRRILWSREPSRRPDPGTRSHGGGRRRRLGTGLRPCAPPGRPDGSCTTSTHSQPSPHAPVRRGPGARDDPARDRPRPRGTPARTRCRLGRRGDPSGSHGPTARGRSGTTATGTLGGQVPGGPRGRSDASPRLARLLLTLRRSIQHGAPAVLEPRRRPRPSRGDQRALQPPPEAGSEPIARRARRALRDSMLSTTDITDQQIE